MTVRARQMRSIIMGKTSGIRPAAALRDPARGRTGLYFAFSLTRFSPHIHIAGKTRMCYNTQILFRSYRIRKELTSMKKEILKILERDSRLTDAQIAAMLGLITS